MTMRLAGGPDGLRLWFQPDRVSESVSPRGGSVGSARSRHDDPRHRPPALAAAAGARTRIGGRSGEAAGWDRHSERRPVRRGGRRSEEHTSELQSLAYLVCRLLLEKKKNKTEPPHTVRIGRH